MLFHDRGQLEKRPRHTRASVNTDNFTVCLRFSSTQHEYSHYIYIYIYIRNISHLPRHGNTDSAANTHSSGRGHWHSAISRVTPFEAARQSSCYIRTTRDCCIGNSVAVYIHRHMARRVLLSQKHTACLVLLACVRRPRL